MSDSDTPLPILGFRSWAWAECSQRLVAPVRGLEWPPLEKFEAGCSYNDMIDKFALGRL